MKRERRAMIDRAVYPRIPLKGLKLTLCGSTRFPEAFEYWNAQLTLAGNIVYSVALMPRHSNLKGLLTEQEKQQLDEIHLRKIDNSDAIFVIDVGGYLGQSTKGEIEYALSNGKGVYKLSEFTVVSPPIQHRVA
jgi:hypothetical protein